MCQHWRTQCYIRQKRFRQKGLFAVKVAKIRRQKNFRRQKNGGALAAGRPLSHAPTMISEKLHPWLTHFCTMELPTDNSFSVLQLKCCTIAISGAYLSSFTMPTMAIVQKGVNAPFRIEVAFHGCLYTFGKLGRARDTFSSGTLPRGRGWTMCAPSPWRLRIQFFFIFCLRNGSVPKNSGLNAMIFFRWGYLVAPRGPANAKAGTTVCTVHMQILTRAP